MSRLRVDVKILRAGQPRAYADSIYEAEMSFRNWWDSTTGEREGMWIPDERHAKELAKTLVQHFDDPPEDGLSARLDKIEKRGRTWFVRIIEPYCD